ncbi:MAG: fatty acid desaturase [Verrucomicrobiota bacterium]|nr:fatty acid desaturase [Verrucomicrobiota bacterium]
METIKPKYQKNAKINWYRTKVDKKVMSALIKQDNWHGFMQVGLQLGFFIATGLLAYAAFLNIQMTNWYWAIPLLLLALFVHGTQGPFLGLVAIHELCHKTPFKSKLWNEFFLKVYSFLSWSDPIWFRPSHVKHHQVTVHSDYDGEVTLPQSFNFRNWPFWLGILAIDPRTPYNIIKATISRAKGIVDGDWNNFVLPEEDKKMRKDYANWARFQLIGHLVLATLFIATGNWFLILVFNFGSMYCTWLGFLCGSPQHYGMSPNVPDFRLCCRTYTCSWLPGFLYWNMQYHIEHHMYPGVPFYNLPKLRKAIEHDLPPAPHGLWATWQGILDIHKKTKTDPSYQFIPRLPQSKGEFVDDLVLENEASLTA